MAKLGKQLEAGVGLGLGFGIHVVPCVNFITNLDRVKKLELIEKINSLRANVTKKID